MAVLLRLSPIFYKQTSRSYFFKNSKAIENFKGSEITGIYLLIRMFPFILIAFVKYQKARALPILLKQTSKGADF